MWTENEKDVIVSDLFERRNLLEQTVFWEKVKTAVKNHFRSLYFKPSSYAIQVCEIGLLLLGVGSLIGADYREQHSCVSTVNCEQGEKNSPIFLYKELGSEIPKKKKPFSAKKEQCSTVLSTLDESAQRARTQAALALLIRDSLSNEFSYEGFSCLLHKFQVVSDPVLTDLDVAVFKSLGFETSFEGLADKSETNGCVSISSKQDQTCAEKYFLHSNIPTLLGQFESSPSNFVTSARDRRRSLPDRLGELQNAGQNNEKKPEKALIIMMPHCDISLYGSVLWYYLGQGKDAQTNGVDTRIQSLGKVCIIGNSFDEYVSTHFSSGARTLGGVPHELDDVLTVLAGKNEEIRKPILTQSFQPTHMLLHILPYIKTVELINNSDLRRHLRRSALNDQRINSLQLAHAFSSSACTTFPKLRFLRGSKDFWAQTIDRLIVQRTQAKNSRKTHTSRKSHTRRMS